MHKKIWTWEGQIKAVSLSVKCVYSFQKEINGMHDIIGYSGHRLRYFKHAGANKGVGDSILKGFNE